MKLKLIILFSILLKVKSTEIFCYSSTECSENLTNAQIENCTIDGDLPKICYATVLTERATNMKRCVKACTYQHICQENEYPQNYTINSCYTCDTSLCNYRKSGSRENKINFFLFLSVFGAKLFI